MDDFRRHRREHGGEPLPGAAEIRAGQHDPGAYDADPDLAHAGDGEHEGVAVHAAGRAELIAGDDCGRVAGERCRVGGEVVQQRGGQRAGGAPQRETDEKRGPLLGEASREHDDCERAHDGADHAEPALAQRGAELRLAHDRGRGASPERVVELEPERHVKREADRGPHTQSEEQGRTCPPQGSTESAPSWSGRPPPPIAPASLMEDHSLRFFPRTGEARVDEYEVLPWQQPRPPARFHVSER
jgi:hypothetical protein